MSSAPAKPKAKMGGPAYAGAKISDYGLERLCDRIEAGASVGAILAEIGAGRGALRRWLDDPEHPERRPAYEAARTASADSQQERALSVLEALPDDPSTGQVAKAREIANHLRWAAARIDPASYGDRIKIERPVEDLDSAALSAEIDALQQRLGIKAGGAA